VSDTPDEDVTLDVHDSTLGQAADDEDEVDG
jgi:hypothetical protein